MESENWVLDYAKVERAIAYLEEHSREQPGLEEIAQAVALSPYHFQRLFGRWVGVSPKRFLQYLTKEHALRLLRDSHTVLDASYEAGLSGPGRLHDLIVQCEAVTPGEARAGGGGVEIRYGFHPSPFGRCLIAATSRGICALEFVRADPDEAVALLRRRWPDAALVEDSRETAMLARRVFAFGGEHEPAPLHLYVRGTNFQIQVWQALLKIPLGRAVSYEDVARHIGAAGASRAVGGAVARNPIPFLIPCHRVIRKSGGLGGYSGGRQRKKAILAWESALAGPTAGSKAGAGAPEPQRAR
jgi:AraC family transcriptional regulator of adaptative response/methylated-DNA-[protein]-cysteine methyltransferase